MKLGSFGASVAAWAGALDAVFAGASTVVLTVEGMT